MGRRGKTYSAQLATGRLERVDCRHGAPGEQIQQRRTVKGGRRARLYTQRGDTRSTVHCF